MMVMVMILMKFKLKAELVDLPRGHPPDHPLDVGLPSRRLRGVLVPVTFQCVVEIRHHHHTYSDVVLEENFPGSVVHCQEPGIPLHLLLGLPPVHFRLE